MYTFQVADMRLQQSHLHPAFCTLPHLENLQYKCSIEMSLTTTHFCVLSLRQTHFLYPIETFSVFIQTHVFLKFSYHIYWTTSLYSNRKNISFEWQWKWKWSCSVVSNSLWPYDCIPPGSSIHGISQARMLEWGPVPSPGDLPDLGIELRSPTLQADSLPSEPPGNPSGRDDVVFPHFFPWLHNIHNFFHLFFKDLFFNNKLLAAFCIKDLSLYLI